jgi:thiamine biosynthesis lipoprotein
MMTTTACSRKIPMLGGEIEVVIYGVDESMSGLIFDDIEREGLRLQKVFSFFDPESELSALNRKRRMMASGELISVIGACIPYCALTGGAYDITRGKEILMRKSGKGAIPSSCSYKDIQMNGSEISLASPEALVDLGSAAKGYIGDRLAGLISGMGIKDFFIDLRGDMIAAGSHAEKVLVQHPREPGKHVAGFMLRNGAVATSGDYSQHYGGYDRSHIVGKKDIISATVVSQSLLEADIVATCIMLVGTKGLSLFHGRHYFAVDEGMNVHKSEGFCDEKA